MSRPKNNTVKVQVWFSPLLLAWVDQQSSLVGMSRSEFLRFLVLQEKQKQDAKA